jgi:hypothetical protein
VPSEYLMGARVGGGGIHVGSHCRLSHSQAMIHGVYLGKVAQEECDSAVGLLTRAVICNRCMLTPHTQRAGLHQQMSQHSFSLPIGNGGYLRGYVPLTLC